MEALYQIISFFDSQQSRWFFSVVLLILVFLYLYIKKGGTIPRFSQSKNLDAYVIDLTAQAREGTIDPVVGRDEEINRVTQVLTRRTKNNVILVGQPGVGKTAVVEGIATRIATGAIPEVLQNKRVLLLQVAELMAGTKYRGEFEQRIKGVVEEIRASNRTIILFIDEIHTVTQIKNTEGAMNLSDILKPALARGDLQLIGATTQKEYEAYIQPDESWDRRFQVVLVDEPTVEEAVAILQGIKKNYEEYHHVIITDDAIRAAVRLSQEYIKGRRLPDKAIDIMDEAAAKMNVERGSVHEHAGALLHGAAKKIVTSAQDETPIVHVEDIREIVAEWIGLNVEDIH